MTFAPDLDPRYILARPDLAELALEGLVKAERYAPVRAMHGAGPVADIFDARSERIDQLLFGEGFDVLEVSGGRAWGRARRDGVVGWIAEDALARAGEHDPDLTIDFATLTGAARVALGPELPPIYTDDETLAGELMAAATDRRDPVWRMPLWRGYREAVEAEIADLRNDSAEWAQAGSVTAALFLQRFAPDMGSWCHFDIFAWNNRARPGWPMGGEAQAIRAVFKVLTDRYGR